MGKNLTTAQTIKDLAELLKQEFARRSDIPEKLSQLQNDQQYQTLQNVTDAINAKLGSTYRPGGTMEAPDTSKLAETNVGLVYNISKAFTTTADFVEGAGHKHPAGANIVVVKHETEEKYLYDVLAGFVDLSNYLEKVDAPTPGNFAALDASGKVVDSEVGPDTFVKAVPGSSLMTSEQASKLDGIHANATEVSVPSTPNGTILVNGEAKQVCENLPDNLLTEDDIQDIGVDELKTLLGLTSEE